MPLIRLARDKRGLDTLYLLHPRPDGRGEPRLRVLYFCAAPQGLAFGRHCLDASTQRALERRHPDVAFDWPALLREIDQRRLPAPVEPQARRPRPIGKTERRPPSSEVTPERSERPANGKRKKRRGGESGSAGAGRVADVAPSPPAAAAPIIES